MTFQEFVRKFRETFVQGVLSPHRNMRRDLMKSVQWLTMKLSKMFENFREPFALSVSNLHNVCSLRPTNIYVPSLVEIGLGGVVESTRIQCLLYRLSPTYF